MFTTPAYAQATASSALNSDMVMQFLPIILVFFVFYFLMFRPQQIKMKQQKAMLAALKPGDRVVTGGGKIGTIAKVVSDDEVLVTIAEGVKVRVVRSTIASVLPKEDGKATKTEAVEDDDDTPFDENTPKSKSSRRRKAAS